LGGTLNNTALIDLKASRFRQARDRLREAVEWQKQALSTNPQNPTYRLALSMTFENLARACAGIGDESGAAEARRELAKLEASDPKWAIMDQRLAAVLKGETPNDNAERLALAQRAYDTRRYTTAAKLWGDALEADPKLADDRQAQHRYNAACAAALTAAGHSECEPAPSEEAKAKLRERARRWLTAELATWTRLLESAKGQERDAATQALAHWKRDPDLAGVRDAEALAKLPESERKAWQALWADVDHRLRSINKGHSSSR
jgi:tetratricopeptide (TPR) repeat protein